MSDTKKRRPNLSFRVSRNSAPFNSRPATTMSVSSPNVSTRSDADASAVGVATRSKTSPNLAASKVSLLTDYVYFGTLTSLQWPARCYFPTGTDNYHGDSVRSAI